MVFPAFGTGSFGGWTFPGFVYRYMVVMVDAVRRICGANHGNLLFEFVVSSCHDVTRFATILQSWQRWVNIAPASPTTSTHPHSVFRYLFICSFTSFFALAQYRLSHTKYYGSTCPTKKKDEGGSCWIGIYNMERNA
jgi:hypothetical protein